MGDAEDEKGKKANIFNLSTLPSIWGAEGKGDRRKRGENIYAASGTGEVPRKYTSRKNYLKLSMKAEGNCPIDRVITNYIA